MRTTPASWCQLSEYPAAEILLAAYCQPVTIALYWKKYIRGQYPVVLTVSEFVNWSAASCIQTSVLRRRSSKAFLLALHDKDRSFIIKSGTKRSRINGLFFLSFHFAFRKLGIWHRAANTVEYCTLYCITYDALQRNFIFFWRKCEYA